MTESIHNENRGRINRLRAAGQLYEGFAPDGIGLMRRVMGSRNWHQTPFLKAMPDGFAFLKKGVMFSDLDYVGFTAWTGGQLTLVGDG